VVVAAHAAALLLARRGDALLTETPLAARAQEPGATAAKSESVAAKSQSEDAAIATIDAFIAKEHVDKSKPSWKSTLAKPPKVTFTPGKTYFWNLVTNKGKIKIKLMPEVAPMHVSSTIYLTRLGFYDDTIFHRVIPGFMAQGGDPTGTGRGGPGYKFADEVWTDITFNRPGVLAMANSGPNTNGSQFFITDSKPNHLNMKHTIFGLCDLETVRKMMAVETTGPEGSTPKEDIVLKKVTISREKSSPEVGP